MRKPKRFSAEMYIEGVLCGNRMMLSKAITLIESRLEEDYPLAQSVIAGCLPYAGRAYRIGITGVPGAGKSTFIEAFGTYVTGLGKTVAVLAIDPSSEITGGSILGDKTRMQHLAANPSAFIRPSPSGGNLGGVTRKTREAMLLCEAAGFDYIIVETVGVGQSETEVSNMTDFFLLLMLPNAGDDLQGIKKGIMENISGMVINKSDGDFLPKARTAKALYSQALRLFYRKTPDWLPPVLLCSALFKEGIPDVVDMLDKYKIQMEGNGFWEENRIQQSLHWMENQIHQQLGELFTQNKFLIGLKQELSLRVTQHEISPMRAADEMIAAFKKSFSYD